MYGLVGEKLGHSYSPELHALFADYGYQLFEIPPEKIRQFFRSDVYCGLNVTIPYKRIAYEMCDELSPAARAIGSVNTLLRRGDGTLYGDNTDAAGFEGMVRKSGFAVKNEKCLVLGSGGTSLTVQHVLKKLGAGQVTVISRTGENNYQNLDRHADAALIVNTTPVGMYPNTGISPLELRRFPACRGVLDIIYNPVRTALVLQANALGIPSMSGLYMLAEQARCAAELFTGKSISALRTWQAVHTLQRRKQNLVLIGMPGSGKSTVGRYCAQLLGRQFADSDTEMEKELGMPIPEILTRYGESAFRGKECEVIARLGKQSGLVLATGGGVVTRPENYAALHQNGTIVFLQRELALLATEGRPLSQQGKLEELFSSRLPMYRQFADVTVENSGDPAAVAKEVIRCYENYGD